MYFKKYIIIETKRTTFSFCTDCSTCRSLGFAYDVGVTLSAFFAANTSFSKAANSYK